MLFPSGLYSRAASPTPCVGNKLDLSLFRTDRLSDISSRMECLRDDISFRATSKANILFYKPQPNWKRFNYKGSPGRETGYRSDIEVYCVVNVHLGRTDTYISILNGNCQMAVSYTGHQRNLGDTFRVKHLKFSFIM